MPLSPRISAWSRPSALNSVPGVYMLPNSNPSISSQNHTHAQPEPGSGVQRESPTLPAQVLSQDHCTQLYGYHHSPWLFLHAGNRSRLRLPQVRVGVYAMRSLSVPHIWLKLAKAKKKQTGLLWLTKPKIAGISASGHSRTPGLHGHHPDLAAFTPPASQL